MPEKLKWYSCILERKKAAINTHFDPDPISI